MKLLLLLSALALSLYGQSGTTTYQVLGVPGYYCADAGSTDAYACSITPPLDAYRVGTHYTFKANTANTGAATLNLNSLGAIAIKTSGGADLSTGDIVAGQMVNVIYAAGPVMQMQSPAGSASTSIVNVKDYGATGDGSTDDTAAIQAAVTATNAAGGGELLFPEGSYKISNIVWKDNVRGVGVGENVTKILFTDTTGVIFDFTDVSFAGLSHMSISPNGVQKTAGQVVLLDTDAGSCQRNEFHDIRISSSYIGFEIRDATTTTINGVQYADYNASWGQHSFIFLSGTTTSTTLNNLTLSSAATFSAAAVYISGGTVDTVLGVNWEFAQSSGDGLRITNGRIIELTNLVLESGTTNDGLYISGGHEINLVNVHLLGRICGVITGGSGISLNGGRVIKCQLGGISLTGGTFVQIRNMEFSDVSEGSTGTYDGIGVTAGVVDFNITGNTFGQFLFNTSAMRYGVLVSVGASDRYTIANNNYRTVGTGNVSDGGTGTFKYVESGFGRVTNQVGGVASTYSLISDSGYASTLSLKGGRQWQLTADADSASSRFVLRDNSAGSDRLVVDFNGNSVFAAKVTSVVQNPGSVAFASLPGSPTNGDLIYCSDCTKATPCASGGSGALAKRINGAWDCD